MNRKNTGLVTMLVLLALLVLSCNGVEEDSQGLFTETEAPQTLEPNVNVPGYLGGSVPWEYEEGGVVPVLVKGQTEVTDANSKSASSLGGIAFIAPPEGNPKASSTLSAGADYYMSKNIAVSEVNGMTFTPADGDPAFAMYELFAPTDTPFTVGVAWYSLPDAMDSYFVGIGDSELEVWHWYQGPGDGVLTFNPDDWSRPGDIDDTVLVCIAVEAGKPADFWQVNWGVSEIRGTGLEWEDDDNFPVDPEVSGKSASFTYPASFSLREYLPPISDQGYMGSCTAFAVSDAGFNILLSRMYENRGWDPSLDENRASPMFNYVSSGIPPIANRDPPCGPYVGRAISQAFQTLMEIGTATEASAPYVATSNCETTFSDEANSEAQVLRLSSWGQMLPEGIVMYVKGYLAAYGRPVVMSMRGLEDSFLNYNGGVYQYGGTPGSDSGHAMCIVGYDDELQAFDVRNSWGKNWGNDGYWWCGYDAIEALIYQDDFFRLRLFTIRAEFNHDAVDYFFGEDAVPDEIEPNDLLAQATTLPDFSFSDYTFSNFTGYLGQTDTVDYFSFSQQESLCTDFTLYVDDASGTLFMEIVDSSGTILAESTEHSVGQKITCYWSSPGTAYLRVRIEEGQSDYTIEGKLRVPPPTPSNLIASDGTRSDGVQLTWLLNENSLRYYIYRADNVDGTYEMIGSNMQSEYLDQYTIYGQIYWYKINNSGDYGYSPFCEPVPGSRATPAPTGISASDSLYPDKISVSWYSHPWTDTYIVKRSLSAEGPFNSVASVTGNSYDDFMVDGGVTYYYTVCVDLGDGRSGPDSISDAGSTSGSNQVDPEELADDLDEKTNVTKEDDYKEQEGVQDGDGKTVPIG